MIMAASKSDNSRAAAVIKNWLRNRGTIEFLGTWEQIYNPRFKVVEFDHFKGNLYLYEKMGYHQTGKEEHINDQMDIVFYEKD